MTTLLLIIKINKKRTKYIITVKNIILSSPYIQVIVRISIIHYSESVVAYFYINKR